MGKPLMIQSEDDDKIENLKERIGASSKVDVIRQGLRLLEQETDRKERMMRWAKSVKLVAGQSKKVNQDFQKHARLKRS